MEVIPAIDVMGGRCVQLVGGRPETKVDYGDPVEVALKWKQAGARILHVVDLDAALGTGSNIKLVGGIMRSTGLQVNFGGGIRTVDYARKVLESGVDRIVLGTFLIEDMKQGFKFTKKLSEEYGSKRLIGSVDSRGGFVAVKGWTERTGIKAAELTAMAEGFVWGFLYTNVDVEGQMKGVDIEAIKKVVKSTSKPVIVSGGVTTIQDIKSVGAAGGWGVVLGKALYEGRIDLAKALSGKQ
ncbi:MAG: 1-(5-phosphoribosyl)-5-[(5-phosphoribosylamino)methylideneamino]imidazole-4-carboxamide isomerase [Candidatus Altiarchaeota archaeon]|nr:1-(5-phosphoribosyl)-5-[(5-phosphoribosylamino)methylideneamino]imidazole-4-carboxamide isomerase [Candidatus Altiarchaeota archaeon]